MDVEKKNDIWTLVIGKVHRNLECSEEKAYQEVANSDDTKRILKQVQFLYSRVKCGFAIQNINKEKNWNRINHEISYVSPIRRFFPPLVRYAALFIIALSIGVFASRFINRTQSLANNRLEVVDGQMSRLALSDGTKVWLNAGSAIEYPSCFDSDKRQIILNGEAQFKVFHNSKVPFEVTTKFGLVKVYGTTFNVASYDDDPVFSVTLVEGKVAVENIHGDHIATLNPSEQLIIDKKTGEISLRKVDTRFYTSWINGRILLEDTKLSDLSRILKRWYNVDINLVGEKVGDLQVSGTIIKNKPLEPFLKILERMYGIRCEMKINSDKKDEITIYKN